PPRPVTNLARPTTSRAQQSRPAQHSLAHQAQGPRANGADLDLVAFAPKVAQNWAHARQPGRRRTGPGGGAAALDPTTRPRVSSALARARRHPGSGRGVPGPRRGLARATPRE